MKLAGLGHLAVKHKLFPLSGSPCRVIELKSLLSFFCLQQLN